MRRGSALAWAALDLCVCLILVIYVEIAPPKKPPSTPTQGLYAVTQTCPTANQDDVDLYVRDPQGKTVYFQAMTAGLMHLEQDVIPGQTTIEGGTKITEADNERVILLGVVPGEYVVNEHMYAIVTGPEDCTATLWDLRQGYTEITSQTVHLRENGAIQTPFRFVIGANKTVKSISHLPLNIVYSTTP